MEVAGREKFTTLVIFLLSVIIVLAGAVVFLWRAADQSLVNRSKQAEASVVGVVATKNVEESSGLFFGGAVNSDVLEAAGGGTGFFVSPEGLIATNDHILAGENYTAVTASGEKFPARVIRQFPEKDIAFLKIDGGTWPAVEFKLLPPVVKGQKVFSLGNSLGYYSGTLHTGVVSAPNRRIEKNGLSFEEMVQVEMHIAEGDSGAPLFDETGRVIGMLTAFDDRAEGLAFAIPGRRIVEALDLLEE